MGQSQSFDDGDHNQGGREQHGHHQNSNTNNTGGAGGAGSVSSRPHGTSATSSGSSGVPRSLDDHIGASNSTSSGTNERRQHANNHPEEDNSTASGNGGGRRGSPRSWARFRGTASSATTSRNSRTISATSSGASGGGDHRSDTSTTSDRHNIAGGGENDSHDSHNNINNNNNGDDIDHDDDDDDERHDRTLAAYVSPPTTPAASGTTTGANVRPYAYPGGNNTNDDQEPPSLIDYVDSVPSEDFTVQTGHTTSPVECDLGGGSSSSGRQQTRSTSNRRGESMFESYQYHHQDSNDNDMLEGGDDNDLFNTPPTQPRNIRVFGGAVGAGSSTAASPPPPQYNLEAHDGASIEVDRMSSADPDSAIYYVRRPSIGSTETGSTVSYMDEEDDDAFAHHDSSSNTKGQNSGAQEFYPQKSKDNEWMGRSVENLILGHKSRAPILQLADEDEENADAEDFYYAFRRRSTASTFGGGGYGRRRSSAGSFAGGGRRGSISLSGTQVVIGGAGAGAGSTPGSAGGYHGGTLANYYNNNNRRRQVPTDVDRSFNERQGRRGSTSTHTPVYRRRTSMAGNTDGDMQRGGGGGASAGVNKGGPNAVLTLLARENTGKTFFPRGIPATHCLRSMGGHALLSGLDKPAAGICAEVAFLEAAIDTGDWSETQTIISRLAPRIIGDPLAAHQSDRDRAAAIDDPTLPRNAHKFYAGGGRTGLERDAFVQAGGVEVLIRVFREKSFVGQEMAYSYDARDLSPEIVAARLAPSWNESLAMLRELVFSIPSLVEERRISDQGEFLPFLFTLLSHQSCFDGAAALIEEILALLSQSPQQQQQPPVEVDGTSGEVMPTFQPVGRVSPPTTFFLGNVPDLYRLWRSFNSRQLAHFCRILALLVFEPEDRQILESPAVLKSLELLQLRRNRAVRAGRDSTVDMNQAILLGDETLIRRLLMLLRVMNFAPALRRIAPYHVMAQYPFIADTLIMLLGELESWSEIDRQEAMARQLLVEENADISSDEPELLLSELGGIADMLDGLSDTLGEATNQIGHIIHVISAAQQAGVIVGRSSNRNRRSRGRNQRNNNESPAGSTTNESPPGSSPQPSAEDQESAAAALRLGGIPIDNATVQGLASVAGILTDQVLVRRLYQSTGDDLDGGTGGGLAAGGESSSGEDEPGTNASNRHFINTPDDCANILQFNAILLGSYQVEVLFVLCTLLGGRRKLDAQDLLEKLGLVPVLDDMFQRLPWFRKMYEGNNSEEGENNTDENRGGGAGANEQQNGIHGPGCECTPESALCVQYLRLLHNFCARDCDNYSGRRLLLSDSERNFVFHGPSCTHHSLKPGLLSKIIGAFINETDESPYRFWLASCIESYLRGSSTEEQMFAAQSGLMQHLIDDVSSERLHCAGSLQTSFDLLGELGKGNSDVIRLLVNDLDEERFRKLMSVAAANLVDSNVFIRSLLLSLERLSAADMFLPLYVDSNSVGTSNPFWMSETGGNACSYLTHSWWDAKAIPLVDQGSDDSSAEDAIDEDRQSDWFPTLDLLEVNSGHAPEVSMLPSGLEESVGHYGWVFTPGGGPLSTNTYLPNTVERLSWFLAANQARLLRDLLGVVDLRNINHENICCLNTAVVIAIFAYRRRQLSVLLDELRQMNDEEKETKRRTRDAASHHDDIVDRAFTQAMRYLDLNDQREAPPYARRASITAPASLASPASPTNSQQIGDRTDVMRNFREVLWFWTEYYTHRGRDRLSLEFSSHLRFQEWNHVVSLLSADDGSPTALIRSLARLPRSPYERAARHSENPIRGV